MNDVTETTSRQEETETRRGSGRTSLSSVSNALKMLKAFSDETSELGITELAKSLSVAKSTAHRIASTLVNDGFLEKNPANEKYRLGLALFRLGAQVRRRMNVSYESRPMLMDLRAKTNETILLAIPDEDQILYAFHLESSHAIRMRSDIGVRKPMVCTAEGQVMLAYMSESRRLPILKEPIKKRTAHTITDPEKLKAKLDTIRVQGYSLEDQESETGMRSIAAPIYNSERNVVGCVALAGPVIRMKDDLIPGLADQVIQTAMQISQRLGY
ncbi:IclR family transcriptional regulator [Saccharospirillum sp.]|uniref:IclR family transcriptional regulator n=1 Tax=Saccharospirillum sp. TaxID=2033801 RepID=UPI0034A02758